MGGSTAGICTTVINGTNADLIKEAARLYITEGFTVADITYGKGVFWREVDQSRFTLLASDLHQHDIFVRIADFRSLPYADASIDVVVFDPPYLHNVGNHMTDARYRNKATTAGMYHADIIDLYAAGMYEAARVLKPEGGQLWVKCKDEVEGGVQRWSHIEIYQIALKLEMFARDLFVLVPTSRTSHNRWKRQIHARKTHSYLWVFEKPRKSDRAALKRAKILE